MKGACSEAEVLKLEHAPEFPAAQSTDCWRSPPPPRERVSDSRGREPGLRIYVSSTFLGDAYVAGLRTTLLLQGD